MENPTDLDNVVHISSAFLKDAYEDDGTLNSLDSGNRVVQLGTDATEKALKCTKQLVRFTQGLYALLDALVGSGVQREGQLGVTPTC